MKNQGRKNNKQKQKHEEKRNHSKHNGLDRKLYFCLLCVSVFITIACFVIPQNSRLFAIGTGIGCGGVASTIVAWLIDEANSRRALKRIKENRDVLINKFFMSFDNGLQLLIIAFGGYVQNGIERNWFDWTETAYEIQKNNPELCKDYRSFIGMLFDEVLEQVLEIESQTAGMLEYGLIEKEDIETLSLIQSSCEYAQHELKSAHDEKQIINTVRTCCKTIKMALSYSLNMLFINEKPIEPKLNNILYKHNKDDKR